MVCNQCFSQLQYEPKHDRRHVGTLAHYDLGKIPKHLKKLPPLSLAEKLAISTVIVFKPIVHFKAVNGSRNDGIKGHVFASPLTKPEKLEKK